MYLYVIKIIFIFVNEEYKWYRHLIDMFWQRWSQLWLMITLLQINYIFNTLCWVVNKLLIKWNPILINVFYYFFKRQCCMSSTLFTNKIGKHIIAHWFILPVREKDFLSCNYVFLDNKGFINKSHTHYKLSPVKWKWTCTLSIAETASILDFL